MTAMVTSPRLIALLCSVVGPTPSGGDRLAVELARHWPADPGATTIVTTAAGKLQLEQLNTGGFGFRVHGRQLPFQRSRLAVWSLGALTAAFAARQVVRQSVREGCRPIVLSSSPFLPDVIAGLVGRLSGGVWLQSWQLVLPSPFARGTCERLRSALSYWSQGICLRLARRYAEKLIVPTRLMAAEARRRGFRGAQICVAGYAVDHAEMSSALPSDGRREKYDAIFLGRFHAQKGLSDLLDTWKLVQRAKPEASLAIIGDGDGREAVAFKARLQQFPKGTVHRLGVLTGREKYEAMARARIFLFPSHHESWGHVVIEAMAVGLPVVGYDLPSSVEAFGDAMIMVSLGNVADLAQQVLALLDDERLRKRYQELGKRLAAKYDWGAVTNRVFQPLCSRPGALVESNGYR